MRCNRGYIWLHGTRRSAQAVVFRGDPGNRCPVSPSALRLGFGCDGRVALVWLFAGAYSYSGDGHVEHE